MAFPTLCALGARGDNPPAMRVDGNILIKPPSRGILTIVQAVKIRVGKVVVAMVKKAYSLSNTKWMHKYHIVFTLKCRRKIIYNQIRDDICLFLEIEKHMRSYNPCLSCSVH